MNSSVQGYDTEVKINFVCKVNSPKTHFWSDWEILGFSGQNYERFFGDFIITNELSTPELRHWCETDYFYNASFSSIQFWSSD